MIKQYCLYESLYVWCLDKVGAWSFRVSDMYAGMVRH